MSRIKSFIHLYRRLVRATSKLQIIRKPLYKLWQAMHRNALPATGDMLRAIGIVRAPLSVGLLGACALSVPGQTTALYRVMAVDYSEKFPQVWSAFAACLLAANLFSRFSVALATSNSSRLRSIFGRAVLASMPAVCS